MEKNENCYLFPIANDLSVVPIWLIRGAEPDGDEDDDDGVEIEVDEGDDEEAEGEEDEDGEDGEDEKPKPKPPVKKALPVKKLPPKKIPPKKFVGTPAQKALQVERRARLDAERQLKEIRKLNETQSETRIREAEEAAEAKYKPVAVAAAARAALVEAKFKGDAARGVKLMDITAIDVYEGEAVGIEDQIEAIKAEFPEMFESEEDGERPKKKAPPVKINPGNRKPVDDKKKLTSAEKIQQMVETGSYD